MVSVEFIISMRYVKVENGGLKIILPNGKVYYEEAKNPNEFLSKIDKMYKVLSKKVDKNLRTEIFKELEAVKKAICFAQTG